MGFDKVIPETNTPRPEATFAGRWKDVGRAWGQVALGPLRGQMQDIVAFTIEVDELPSPISVMFSNAKDLQIVITALTQCGQETWPEEFKGFKP